jgi:hypothetical protein
MSFSPYSGHNDFGPARPDHPCPTLSDFFGRVDISPVKNNCNSLKFHIPDPEESDKIYQKSISHSDKKPPGIPDGFSSSGKLSL